ncbi:MAG: capsular polysaccharide biosynthesis protein [Arenibacterium sp.]
MPQGASEADGQNRRLYYFNGGFLTQKRVRRILQLAGYTLRIGLPKEGDRVAVWGNSPTAHRGRSVAARRAVELLHIEDAFLRSLNPGRSGEPPIGLVLDQRGVHFDPAQPSDLEHLLINAPLDDTALLNRARDAIARLRTSHLTKYSALDPSLPSPDPGYVLVVDQTYGDASVTASGADAARFREMLVFAQEEHPGARVIIKTHPETRLGHRKGYFSQKDANNRVTLLSDPVSPWHLLEGAVGVYTVSSQLGFEAILAGHKPRVFGKPFYAGWGLTTDDDPVARRERRLTRAQLFAGAMMLYPTWYDPFHDQLCEIETVLDNLEAETRAWREDHNGWTASEIRLWKRPHFQRFFGRYKRVVFSENVSQTPFRPKMVWAGKADPNRTDITLVKDGFFRSRGLGPELIPPLSLVTDRRGIYYDPHFDSDLEHMIARRAEMNESETHRAERLIARLTKGGITKYNQGTAPPDLPEGQRVLVPGQVVDDASIKRGTDVISDNTLLLKCVRDALPEAVILYKPHPDVAAGLRDGGAPDLDLADMVVGDVDPAALLPHVHTVCTMTSLLGFEALLRGVPVTTLGAPFYAGWGLTEDLGVIPPRRRAQPRPTLAGLVYATLIDYPRYLDPVTGSPCPVEVVLDRLENDQVPRPGFANRGLSKLQGVFASFAHLWR